MKRSQPRRTTESNAGTYTRMYTLKQIDHDIIESNRKTLAAAHTSYRCKALGCESEPRYVVTVYPHGASVWRDTRNWQFCEVHAKDGTPQEFASRYLGVAP